MRNFGSGLTYTINDSTPIIYGNACSVSGFANNMISHASQLATEGGLTGAAGGFLFGGPQGALTGGAVGFGGGLIGGAIYGFGQSAWNCWF